MIALRGIVRRNEEQKWTWTGVWTFGSLPADAAASEKPNSAIRPFSYTWAEPRKASDVLVPSANLAQPAEESKQETEAEKERPGDDVKTSAEQPPVVENKSEPMQVETPVEKAASGDKTNESEPMQVKDVKEAEKEEMKVEKKSAEEPLQMEAGQKDDTALEAAKKGRDKKTPDGKVEEEKEKSAADEQNTSVQPQDESSKKAEVPPPGTEKPSDSESEGTAKDASSTVTPGGTDKNVPATSSTKRPSITFATTSPGEPPFTDASTVHPDKCPPGGEWTGYFENIAPKGRVTENCCMLFNATPPKDARVLFPESAAASSEVGLLPPGHIHVRGTGKNQYGTFELTGSLDLATGVLECQRMYILTKALASPPRKRRRRGIALDGTSPLARSSRKRQASWRKRASLTEYEEEESTTVRTSSTRKKARGASLDMSGASLLAPSTATGMATKALSIMTAGGGGGRRSPTPSPRTAVGPRKRASSKASGASANSSVIKLPTAGDPMDARWRAAHFLYYQRYDPSSDEAGGASGAGSSSAASYVVYEGEMSKGDCLRDGRGICLYNNGTMYAGEWKRNMEHGKGTLMTADRKRVIYEGEWERGRMHGHGVYYYDQDSPYFARRKEGQDSIRSQYKGDFKENMRHGIGTYILPDGSIYEGEWRDNLMSGRGTFRWPDGSVYNGAWTDGKRNGSGILHSSDGFVYDGMWVMNSMDGRGIATYPSGQRYEGLWANGRREGRGTIHFTNGAVYEGRFRDDYMEGQGTMKMERNVIIPQQSASDDEEEEKEKKEDWMIPISFQSDMGHIHQKAGFTVGGE